jgi:hypothetical protein
MNNLVSVTNGEWTKTLNKSKIPETGDWTWYYSDFYRIVVKNLNGGDNYIVLKNSKGMILNIDNSVLKTLGTIIW